MSSFLPKHLTKYAILKLYVDGDDELKNLYKEHIQKHNAAILSSEYPNSGFDILCPEDKVFDPSINSQMFNMKIKTEMRYYKAERHSSTTQQTTSKPSPFLLHPRSSLSKTPLMLANHTGIIDSGYRGWIIGAFRNLSSCNAVSNEVGIGNVAYYSSNFCYNVEKYTRLLQICHPSLCPIYVEMVDNEEDLSTTERGEGGFGSTGITGAIV